MRSLKCLLLAAVLAGAGCGDDKTTKPDAAMMNPDGGGTTPDGGGSTNPDGRATTPDGAGVTPDAGTARTLVEFVTDQVKNKTTETSTPESIEDKTLTDTSDPAAFDSLF